MTACWPRARPAAAARAVIKAVPADFQVIELPGFVPDGDGEHLYLELRKTDLTTVAVADWLAGCFDVAPLAVGYAGMKDKRAVTTQWFSVRTPGGPERLTHHRDIELLQSARHRCKLRRGTLAGNRFRLRLTGVRGDGWEEALSALRDGGAPNYFGVQRFGRDNLAQARAWLARGRRGRVGAFRRGLYLSALRSFLFNEVLAARVRTGVWNVWLPGDVAAAPAVPGNASAPTGPLWGRGRSPAEAAAAAMERLALASHQPILEGLEHAGLTQQRRSLILRARELEWRRSCDVVELDFTLGAGEFATVLLAEVFDLTPIEAAR